MGPAVIFSYVPDKQDSIEHELIRTGTLVEFEIIDTRIEPTAAGDHSHVHLTLQIPEDDVESYAFALVYVLGLLSFHDGRPRGYSGKFFDDDDEWRTADMLRHLEFRPPRPGYAENACGILVRLLFPHNQGEGRNHTIGMVG
jgi:hypothetical protein